MTAHISSFPHPVPNRHSPRPSAGGGSALGHWVFLLGGLVALVATTTPKDHPGADTELASTSTEVSDSGAPVLFSVQAQGITVRTVPVFAVPGAVDSSMALPSGTTVEIGGQLRVASGMGLHALNWVRANSVAGLSYGFVPADAVRLTAGEPALLDGSDLSAKRWSRPEAAASYAGGEANPVETDNARSDVALAATDTTSQVLSIAWMPAPVGRWWTDIERVAKHYGVDPELVAIIVLVESGGDPAAKSPAGATGLMQLMPGTAREVASQVGLRDFNLASLTEPATNIELGTAYLAEQLKRFGQASDPDWQTSIELAAAAYNGGPGTVTAMRAGSRQLPAETRRYVSWVGGMWRDRRLVESATFSHWWSAGGQHLVQIAERRLAALP